MDTTLNDIIVFIVFCYFVTVGLFITYLVVIHKPKKNKEDDQPD